MPVASTSLLGQRVDQERALERFPRYDQPLDALEVTLRLLLGVRRTPRRKRLQVTVAATAGVAGDAARVSCARAREDWLDWMRVLKTS